MSIVPITPNDVIEHKTHIIPDEVIQCWNDIIARNYCNGYSKVMQNSIINDIRAVIKIDRTGIFERHWLDIQDIYQAAGWSVETYKEFLIFRKRIS